MTVIPSLTHRIVLPARFDSHELEWFGQATQRFDEQLELDLEEVGFIDSAGLRALVELRARALELDRDVRIVSCSQAARITFELAGLEEILPVEAAMAEAA